MRLAIASPQGVQFPCRPRWQGRNASAERRHYPFGDALELLQHDGAWRADAGGEVDVLHAGVARLEPLQVLNQLLGRAGEPGAKLHVVVERRHTRLRPAATSGGGGHLVWRDAGHEAKRREHLDVLLVIRRELADGRLPAVGEVEENANRQVLAELEVLAGTCGRVVIGLNGSLGHGGRATADGALDAVPDHEVEPARAGAHHGLPALDGPGDGAWYQRQLLEGVTAVWHLRWQGVVLALVRERGVVEGLEDDLDLLLEQLAVGVLILHR